MDPRATATSCLLVATDKHEPNPYRMWLSQSLAPQNPKSKCNFASCSEAKAKPGRLSGEGRWQAELSDPQGPAQILSHDLMTSCHVSFYLCHPSSHLLAHLCPRLKTGLSPVCCLRAPFQLSPQTCMGTEANGSHSAYGHKCIGAGWIIPSLGPIA